MHWYKVVLIDVPWSSCVTSLWGSCVATPGQHGYFLQQSSYSYIVAQTQCNGGLSTTALPTMSIINTTVRVGRSPLETCTSTALAFSYSLPSLKPHFTSIFGRDVTESNAFLVSASFAFSSSRMCGPTQTWGTQRCACDVITEHALLSCDVTTKVEVKWGLYVCIIRHQATDSLYWPSN